MLLVSTATTAATLSAWSLSELHTHSTADLLHKELQCTVQRQWGSSWQEKNSESVSLLPGRTDSNNNNKNGERFDKRMKDVMKDALTSSSSSTVMKEHDTAVLGLGGAVVATLETVHLTTFLEQCQAVLRAQPATGSASNAPNTTMKVEDMTEQQKSLALSHHALVTAVYEGHILRQVELNQMPTVDFLTHDPVICQLITSWTHVRSFLEKLNECDSMAKLFDLLLTYKPEQRTALAEHWIACYSQLDVLSNLQGEQSADLETRLRHLATPRATTPRTTANNNSNQKNCLLIRWNASASKFEKVFAIKQTAIQQQTTPFDLLSDELTHNLMQTVRTTMELQGGTVGSQPLTNGGVDVNKFTRDALAAWKLLLQFQALMEEMINSRFPLSDDGWCVTIPFPLSETTNGLNHAKMDVELQIRRAKGKWRQWIDHCKRGRECVLLTTMTLKQFASRSPRILSFVDLVKNPDDNTQSISFGSLDNADPLVRSSRGTGTTAFQYLLSVTHDGTSKFLHYLVKLHTKFAAEMQADPTFLRILCVSERTTQFDLEWELDRVASANGHTVLVMLESAFNEGLGKVLIGLLEECRKPASKRRTVEDQLSIVFVHPDLKGEGVCMRPAQQQCWELLQDKKLGGKRCELPHLTADEIKVFFETNCAQRGKWTLVASDGPSTGKSSFVRGPDQQQRLCAHIHFIQGLASDI